MLNRDFEIGFYQEFEIGFDRGLFKNLWYELSPRVCCAFGNVFFLKKRRLSQNHFSAKRKNDRFSVICLSGPFWCYARPKNHGNEVFSWFSRKMCSKAKEGGECCTPLSNDFEEKKTWTPLMLPSLFPASPMEAHKATKCHLSIRNLENSRPPETIHKKKTKQKKKGEV